MRLPGPSGVGSNAGLPLWPPLLAARVLGTKSDAHAHHAMHVVLATRGRLRVRGAATSSWCTAAGVLTAPDVPHAIDASGREVMLVFFDPESDVGTRLRAVLSTPFRLLDDRVRLRLVAHAEPAHLMTTGGLQWTRELVELLGGEPPLTQKRAMHPSVRRLLAHLRTLGPDDDTSLPSLSACVGLSPGRLMHVFTDAIGIPLRHYLAWLKLQRAAMAIASGMRLAQAAPAAGFADSAHMTRTFRRMFGMTPSALRRAL